MTLDGSPTKDGNSNWLSETLTHDLKYRVLPVHTPKTSNSGKEEVPEDCIND